MQAFGAPQEQIAATIADRQSEDKKNAPPYLVEHCNWDAYQMFMRMQTQWNVHGFTGKLIGLQYSSLIDVIKLLHNDNADVIFSQVQLIEHGYLAEINKSG